MNKKLKELELRIEELKLKVELMNLKENYHTPYIIPQTKPIQPKPYPDLGTSDPYPGVWYPETICIDVNLCPTN